MTSTPKHRISGTHRRTASVTLVFITIVLMTTGIAAHLARANRASGAIQQSNAPQPFGATRVPTPPWTLTTLYAFTGPDGANPLASLIRDSAGNLYGTTSVGGDVGCNISGGSGCGVVFKVDTAGNETVLHSFDPTDGRYSIGSLIPDAAGNLYGTTSEGGDLSCGKSAGCGVVFEIDTAGNETVLHAFRDGADGANPLGNVVRDTAGNLYGTTQDGGDLNCPGGCGVVYKLDAKGNETVLYTFTGGADGAAPEGGLIHDAAGNLYGTTSYGGDLNCSISSAVGCGVVYKLDMEGSETVLYTFTGVADGAGPGGDLIHDTVGNLYGATSEGGEGTRCYAGCGVIFKLGKDGVETVLHSFTKGVDGGRPNGGLIQDPKGNLYGITSQGGDYLTCQPPNGCGVVFKLDPTGKETVLYVFKGGAQGLDEGGPAGGLIHDAAGNLYGTTLAGGDFTCAEGKELGCGTVFRLTPQ